MNYLFYQSSSRLWDSWGTNKKRDWGQSSFPLKSTFQDLFISGDVDEVLSRGALHQLKWCQVKEDIITGDSFENQSNKSCVRWPLDANWEPRSSPSYRLPCPWKTSHFQSANYLQGDQANLVNCFLLKSVLSQWKKIEKRELNGRRLQEVTPVIVLFVLFQSFQKAPPSSLCKCLWPPPTVLLQILLESIFYKRDPSFGHSIVTWASLPPVFLCVKNCRKN